MAIAAENPTPHGPSLRLNAARSALVVIDIQARLAPATHAPEPVIANAALLMRAAARLDVPILVTEQYPKGLGATVPEIADLAPADAILSKLHFSCLGDDGFRRRFEALGRPQAVLVGMETHVCVLQTALGLSESGTDCAVVADAVTSRKPADRDAALARLRDAGIAIVTTEMVVFEWLERAGTDAFRDLKDLIK